MGKQLKPIPVDNRVTVLPDRPVDRTKAGIILPQTAIKDSNTGKVVVINELTQSVKVGDHVVYGTHSGTDVEYKGKVYRVMREADIVAII